MTHAEHTAKSTSHRTGIFATLRALLNAKGTSAPASTPSAQGPMRPRRLPLALLIALVLLTSLAFASSASAAVLTATTPEVSNVSYASAKVSGEISVDGYTEGNYDFQVSTDGATWISKANGYFAIFAAGSKQVNAELTGLKAGTEYTVRLTAGGVTSPGPNPSFTTLTADPPTIPGPVTATGVFSTSATATAEVNRPTASDNVNCHFEYISDADFNANPPGEGFVGATVRDCAENPIEAAGTKEVKAPLGCTSPLTDPGNCLSPTTAYHLRLVAENAGGTVTKDAANFTTAPAVTDKPSVLATKDATDVTIHEATVKGEVQRPAGADPAFDVNCRFEYVTQAQFETEEFAAAEPNGQLVGCVENPITEASADVDGKQAVSAQLAGLIPETIYHLRLTAQNSGGTDAEDATNTFETLPAELPTVTIDPVEGGTFTTAHVSGTITLTDGHTAAGEAVVQVSSDGGATWSSFGMRWKKDGQSNVGSVNTVPASEGLFLVEKDLTGLQPSTTYLFRIAASYNIDFTTGGGAGIPYYEANGEVTHSPEPNPEITTEPLQSPPAAENLAVTDLTATSAHFSGTVNPNAPAGPLSPAAKKAYETKWRFECTPECLDANENVIGGTVQGEAGPQTVTGDVKRLDPRTPYEVRLIVSSEGGDDTETVPFSTLKAPPSVKQTPGAPDGEGGYTLQGIVNPHNETVTGCEFKWGPDANQFAFSEDCSPLPSGIDERQRVKVEATAGQFKLSFGGQTTGDIPFDVPGSVVQTELEALSSVGPSGVAEVTHTVEEDTFGRYQIYDVTFSGPLSNKDLPPLQAEGPAVVSTITDGSTNTPITVEAHLTGLNPDAVYRSLLVVTYGADLEKDSGEPQQFKPTLAARQPCPANEQQRTESNSLALPECRAYEMVTPPGKEGFGARLEAYDRGVRVAYGSQATNIAKSGQAYGGKQNQYVAERTDAGWETIPDLNGSSGSLRDAPSYVLSKWSLMNIFTYSQDLLSSTWQLYRQGDPGDGRGLMQHRNPDGTFALVGSTAHPFEVIFPTLLGIATSADLSHLITWKSMWGPGVYEYVGTGMDEPRRVDVDNSGAPISTCATNFGNANASSLSRDGTRVVLRVFGGCGPGNPPAGEIWARVNGSTSFDVSASHCNRTAADLGGFCNGPTEPGGCVEAFNSSTGNIEGPGCRRANFAAATPDGSRVFFTTTQQLVDEDIDQTNDIYACDLPSGNPAPGAGKSNPCAAFRQVSGAKSNADVEQEIRNSGNFVIQKDGFLGTSANGSTVLFVAKGVLADNEDALKEKAVPGDHNLYAWRADASHPDGQTAFLGRLASNDLRRNTGLGSEVAQTTPDGRYLIFTTATQLVDTDTDTARDVYRYDADTGTLTRVSINVFGVAGNGSFDALTPAEKETNLDAPGNIVQPAVSDDGTKVVFTTTEALSPADGNAEPDVYLWTPTRVSLVSTGSSGFAPKNEKGDPTRPRVAIDPSGQDIYFESAQALTPADGDSSTDVYDARIGGGFSFAQPPACSGEDCQGERHEPVQPKLPIGSQIPGPGNPKQKPPCPKGKVRNKKGKCVPKHKKHHKKNGKGKKAGHKQGGGK